jgi:hypothetical protein
VTKDTIAVIKNPNETLKDTNARIREYCRDADVTGAHLIVIAGVPIITLTSETEQMDQDEIDDLTEQAKTDASVKTELEELTAGGFEVPAHEPLMVVVRKLLLTDVKGSPTTKAMSAAEACAFTEDKLNELFEKADGTVHSLQFAECSTTRDAYVLVSFVRDEEAHEASKDV